MLEMEAQPHESPRPPALSASQTHAGRVTAALQAAERLAETAVTLAAREHAQAGGEELRQLTRALESLAGSSQRTEVLLSKGLAALQQLGDVKSLLMQRLPERAPSRVPVTTVGQRVRVRSDVEEPAFGWGAAKSGMIGTVRGISEADGTCLIDFPGNGCSSWRSKLDEVEGVVPEQPANDSEGAAEEGGKAKMYWYY
jgi:hypothetical protein